MAVTGLLAATAVMAHPQIITRSPAAGAVLFSEELEILLSNAKIEGPDGKLIATGPLATDKTRTALIIPIKGRLKAGVYTVSWTIATEEHDMPGRYRFEIKP